MKFEQRRRRRSEKKLERNEMPSYMLQKTETKDCETTRERAEKRERATDRDSVVHVHIHTAVVQLKMHTQIQFEAADKKSHMHKTLTEYNTHIHTHVAIDGIHTRHARTMYGVCWGLLFITFSFCTLIHTHTDSVSRLLAHSLMHEYSSV